MTTPKRVAYGNLVTEEGFVVGLVEENEPGYFPTSYGPYATAEESKAVAAEINEKAYGITDQSEVMRVVASSFAAQNDLKARTMGVRS